jgi:hypothetical protein
VDRNGNLRSNRLAIAVLLLSVAFVEAQTAGKPQAHAGIVGTVLDEQGHPLKNISVHAVLEQTGMYMPTVDSNEAGHFVIENLEPGTYSIFGENDADAYPDTTLPFYPNENPIKVTLGNFGGATIVLVLGPRAGVLCGTVLDKTTGKTIISQHAPRFIVRKISNRADSIEFVGRQIPLADTVCDRSDFGAVRRGLQALGVCRAVKPFNAVAVSVRIWARENPEHKA